MNRKQFKIEELAHEAWREAYEDSLAKQSSQRALEEARQILAIRPSRDEPEVMEIQPGFVEDEDIHRIKPSSDSMYKTR